MSGRCPSDDFARGLLRGARGLALNGRMLKSAELGRVLGKQDYDSALGDLRTALLKAQAELEQASFPVIVLINGADGAGKGETLNTLSEWLDARFLQTEAIGEPSEAERARPEFWRYWMSLPRSGQIGLFLGSWYTQPILDRVMGDGKTRELERALARINSFERTLADGGALFIKLWFHVSKKEQKRRLKAEASAKSTRTLVTKSNWRHHERYDEFVNVTERVLRDTSTGQAPWTVIEAADDRYRNMTAGRVVLEQIQRRLATQRESVPPQAQPEIPDPVTVLDALDLTLKLDKPSYEKRMAELQGQLGELAAKLKKRQRSAIFLFEGSDAAGKGGAIRRLVWALDARQYRIIPIAAPSDEARAREPWKQHKITAEDYRNRQKTHQYEAAAAEMIDRNSTEYAPFTLVEAEDKHYARVKVLETVCEQLERAL